MHKQIARFIVIFLFVNAPSFGQGINNIWITGYDNWAPLPWGNTITDFSSGSPIMISQKMNLDFMRTNASIADTLGNLLFYTNGFAVCNALGDTMPNGAGLDSSPVFAGWYDDGMPVTQGCLIIPAPGAPTLYYLFHETQESPFINGAGNSVYAPRALFYSIIDMNEDSGRGDIVIKEQNVFTDTLSVGRITATKHANGRDWWITVYKYEGNTYVSTLLSSSGLSSPLYQQIGPNLSYNSLGQASFSPQGNKYANVDGVNHLLIMDFDRCTGAFNNPIYIPILDSTLIIRGLAFSPSGQYLYVMSEEFLYQYDVLVSNIDSSRQTVAVWDGTYSPQFPSATTFYTANLAPDGKIYITCGNGTDVMHVINYPDNVGIACDVCQHCLQLPTYNSFGCIPNHPNYFLGAESGSICDSLTTNLLELQYTNLQLKIYPNPANDYFWLNYNLNDQVQNAELSISNSVGEILIQKTLFNHFKSVKLECNNLPSGVYFLTLTTNRRLVGQGKLAVIR